MAARSPKAACTARKAADVAATSQRACLIRAGVPAPPHRAGRPRACSARPTGPTCDRRELPGGRGASIPASSLPPREAFADHRRHLDQDRRVLVENVARGAVLLEIA